MTLLAACARLRSRCAYGQADFTFNLHVQLLHRGGPVSRHCGLRIPFRLSGCHFQHLAHEGRS